MLTPPPATTTPCIDPLPAFARPALRYRALAEPDRLRILQLLAGGVHSVGQVAQAIGLSLTATSRHLALLEEAGFIRRQRQGTWVDCWLAPQVAGSVATLLTASLLGPDPAGEAALRDPADLTALDVDEVEFLISMAQGAWSATRGTHEAWAPHMLRLLDEGVRPQLPVLWAAANRLERGESLEGLPLPAEVIARARCEEPDAG